MNSYLIVTHPLSFVGGLSELAFFLECAFGRSLSLCLVLVGISCRFIAVLTLPDMRGEILEVGYLFQRYNSSYGISVRLY